MKESAKGRFFENSNIGKLNVWYENVLQLSEGIVKHQKKGKEGEQFRSFTVLSITHLLLLPINRILFILLILPSWLNN